MISPERMPDTGPTEVHATMVLPSSRVATAVAERLRRRIASDPFVIPEAGKTIDVTISIGIAALGNGDDAASLLKRADQALYRAKEVGRDCVRLLP